MLLGLMAWSAPAASAQAHRLVEGRVVAADTGSPLADVNVFLAHTLTGTTTRADGGFSLGPLPAGEPFTVVASHLGYALFVHELDPAGPDTVRLDVRLPPIVVSLDEVVIAADRGGPALRRIARSEEPSEWLFHMRQFLRLFLGETPNATHCTLLNPDVLVFGVSEDGRVLVAEASAPLEIENKALGYRITYHLIEFRNDAETLRYRGLPRFETLEPRNRREARRWERRRRDAYEGSPRHFLAALLSGGMETAERDGFEIRLALRFEYDALESRPAGTDAVRLRPDGTYHRLVTAAPLHVIYWPDAGPQHSATLPGGGAPTPAADYTSWLVLPHGAADVLSTGHFLDPYAVTMYGQWGRSRVADDLPRDYRPDE
ncbi:MAG: carboxypeptidase-like regulatory domain-containing protein [Rhodothermales bacterium]|nr:carboxypeptidase-like regulatory domain-containing protein [Rhodothermales bacterium]